MKAFWASPATYESIIAILSGPSCWMPVEDGVLAVSLTPEIPGVMRAAWRSLSPGGAKNGFQVG